MNKNYITLKVPAKPEYVMVTRLTSSAVASRLCFSIDEIEDIKIAVAEAQILIMNQIRGPEEVILTLDVCKDNLCIKITGDGVWSCRDALTEAHEQRELSMFMLEAMMDFLETHIEDGLLQSITMHKKCGGLMDS